MCRTERSRSDNSSDQLSSINSSTHSSSIAGNKQWTAPTMSKQRVASSTVRSSNDRDTSSDSEDELVSNAAINTNSDLIEFNGTLIIIVYIYY